MLVLLIVVGATVIAMGLTFMATILIGGLSWGVVVAAAALGSIATVCLLAYSASAQT